MTMQPGIYRIVQVIEQRERQARAEQYRQARLARTSHGRGHPKVSSDQSL